MEIHVIAAVARNGTIGNAGKMPWRLPDDLKHFRVLTTNQLLVCGRKTYEGLPPHKLVGYGRELVVLSQTLTASDRGHVQLARTPVEALRVAEVHGRAELWVIGGGRIYEQFVPRAEVLHLTFVDAWPTGDAFFPDVQLASWRLTELVAHTGFEFATYHRVRRPRDD